MLSLSTLTVTSFSVVVSRNCYLQGTFRSLIICTGDDADIVVWDILTGEKVQVIRCAFHGPIGALAWIPQKSGLALEFAFGCADGSIHLYQRVGSSVCDRILLIDNSYLTFVFQTTYQYVTQEQVHDGPVLDLKYDERFGRLASVGNGFPQVSELLNTNGGKHF